MGPSAQFPVSPRSHHTVAFHEFQDTKYKNKYKTFRVSGQHLKVANKEKSMKGQIESVRQ